MDKKTVIKKLECFRLNADPQHCTEEKCPYNNADPEFGCWCLSNRLIYDALELLKEQEPRELTKEEWEQWKKDERRDPICMVWYGDTTPLWVLKPESVHEPLYLMGKIKLFTKKPMKEQVKWE